MMDALESAFGLFSGIPGAYMVGGSVRDVLLGRKPTDYDMVVMSDPAQQAEALVRAHGGRWVALGKAGRTIHRTILPGVIVDIAAAAGPDIETDLLKRDFTVNALAWDLRSHRLIDPAGGVPDMTQRTLRRVSPTAFHADPLRMLRAFRLGAQLGFETDGHTREAIARQASTIVDAAAERICHELFKMFEVRGCAAHLMEMAGTGLLDAVFPELSSMRGCVQNRHHRHDAYTHSLQAFGHLEDLLANLSGAFPDTASPLAAHFTPGRMARLKFALLLHDIGKPATQSSGPGGERHFYGHERVGSAMAARIGNRLKMNRRATEYVMAVIRHHLRPLQLFSAHGNGALTRRGMTRFYVACGPRTPDVLVGAMADMRAKGAGNGRTTDGFHRFIETMLAAYWGQFQAAARTPPLITGRDLIEAFALEPSPLFRKILSQVEEDRLAGEIGSRQEAMARVRRYLENPPLTSD